MLEKKNIFEIDIENALKYAHQNLHLKFVIDQCYLINIIKYIPPNKTELTFSAAGIPSKDRKKETKFSNDVYKLS